MAELTPKEVLVMTRLVDGPYRETIRGALRSYSELLSMMEFIDDTLVTSPRLSPVLVRELARELGWESIDTGWDKGSP